MSKIGIIFGAKSFEHEISIVSSIALKKVLSDELVYIFVDKNREFYHIPTNKINSKFFSSGEYKKFDKLHINQGGFYKTALFGDKKIEFDFAINVTHGGDGEDGVLAAMFDFFGIPFIGPRVEACVVSCNKHFTKNYADSCGVKTLPSLHFTKNDKIEITDFPCIIKPVRLGSSIGVAIVKSAEELSYALDVAFEFDNEIIVESFINNVKEYNLAGAKANGEFIFSIVEEPKKEEFLDFDKKYLDFTRTERVHEAELSDELVLKLQENFKKIYNHTFDGSLIRCDFFVVDGEVYLNEINPIPGSMANYLFNDFPSVIRSLSKSLPKKQVINITYDYVNKIQSAKGK